MKLPNHIKDKIRAYSKHQNKSYQLNIEIAKWFIEKENIDVLSVHNKYDVEYNETGAIVQDLLVDLVGLDVEEIIEMIENEIED